jgi:hypothetical protein
VQLNAGMAKQTTGCQLALRANPPLVSTLVGWLDANEMK